MLRRCYASHNIAFSQPSSYGPITVAYLSPNTRSGLCTHGCALSHSRGRTIFFSDESYCFKLFGCPDPYFNGSARSWLDSGARPCSIGSAYFEFAGVDTYCCP